MRLEHYDAAAATREADFASGGVRSNALLNALKQIQEAAHAGQRCVRAGLLCNTDGMRHWLVQSLEARGFTAKVVDYDVWVEWP